ncbi:UPF0136 membrane protein [Aphelenchoides besseyi]|nr:UPF0136 membrane protein [Aphelenchoides besseyi]
MAADALGLVYAGLVTLGGVIGFVKAGSAPSFIAGATFGFAAAFGALNSNHVILAIVSGILTGAMGFRFYNSGKIMPAGLHLDACSQCLYDNSWKPMKMTRDYKDTLPVTPCCCYLVNDNFKVIEGLVKCSGDVESGCLEARETHSRFKAYEMPLNTTYYSTRIRVCSFPTITDYVEFMEQPCGAAIFPSYIFICVDANVGIETFREQCDTIKQIQLAVFGLPNRALLLFGKIPDLGSRDHPKMEMIRQVAVDFKADLVQFHPNEAELEYMSENHEKYGIARVWELLENVGTEWPTVILKDNPGRGNSSILSKIKRQENDYHSPLLSALQSARMSTTNDLLDENNWIEKPKMPIPTPKEEEELFKLFSQQIYMPIPEVFDPEVPSEMLPYLQRQRYEAGLQLTYDSDFGQDLFFLSNNPIDVERLSSTETTVFCSQNHQNTLSIVNTNKVLESDSTQRTASTTINVKPESSTTAIEQASLVQKKKKKKSKNKKRAVDSNTVEHLETVAEEESELDTATENAQKLKVKYEQLYEKVKNDRKTNLTLDDDLNSLIESWNIIKNEPANDDQVLVAMKLTEAWFEGKSKPLTDTLAAAKKKECLERV